MPLLPPNPSFRTIRASSSTKAHFIRLSFLSQQIPGGAGRREKVPVESDDNTACYSVQRGILFHKPRSQKIDHNFIDHLKNSLSRTLGFFPPLAGRLATIENDDNTACYSIICNNAGVEFVHTVAGDVSVSDILEPKCVPEELVSSFFRLNGVANFEGTSMPLLGVQVTELVDGIFIASSANHIIANSG
ncbi:hypothetical protein ACS0TY_032876 [Phlomoides rotata]